MSKLGICTKLKALLENLPKTPEAYIEQIQNIERSSFGGRSLLQCLKREETTVLLNRYLNEDLPFIVKKALAYHSGDLHQRVSKMSNAEFPSIQFTKEEVIQMMSAMAIGCFDGGICTCDLLGWQSRYSVDNFLLLEEYFHQMMTYPRMDEIMTIKTITLEELESRESLCSSTVPLSPVVLEMDKRIEDFDHYAFVDFANCHLGGGSLHGASAQEEILFSIIPECCLAMAFCHTMTNEQAIAIKGCTRIGSYTGYGHSFAYTGPFQASNPPAPIEVIGIDANDMGGHYQFRESVILRDINKAKAGFMLIGKEMKGVSSGKWGCGVFGGDPVLKCIQQWISASLVGKEIILTLFKDKEAKNYMDMICEKDMKTVGELATFYILLSIT